MLQAPASFSRKSTPPEGPRRRLILVGASVRAAAQSAQKAGFSVIGIDFFGDTDTLAACDEYHRFAGLGNLDTICRSIPPSDLMHVGGMVEESQILDTVSAHHTVLGPTSQLRGELNDPAVLSQLARLAGLNFPPTFIEPAPTDSWKQDELNRSGGTHGTVMLRKSGGGSGGLGVRWTDRCDQSIMLGDPLTQSSLLQRRRVSPSTTPESVVVGSTFTTPTADYLQQWIAGRSYGATFLSDGSSTCLLGVCRSSFTRKHALPFVYVGSLGPVGLPTEITCCLRQLGCLVMRRGVRGLFNADVVVDASGAAWLLEINPRWSSSTELVERSLQDHGRLPKGTSLLGLAHDANIRPGGALAEWMSKLETAAKSSAEMLYAKRIVYARQETRLDRSRLEQTIAELADSGVTIELVDVPSDGSRIVKGEPILSVIVRIHANKTKGLPHVGRPLRRTVTAVQQAMR